VKEVSIAVIMFSIFAVVVIVAVQSVFDNSLHYDRQTKACAPFANVGHDRDLVICSDIDGGFRVLTVK